MPTHWWVGKLHQVATTVRSRDLVIQRRQQIAEACYVIFGKNGYKSSTVEDVASYLGIDKATLYGYIERKEDLLYLVFCHYIPLLTRRLEAAANGIRDPRQRLERIIDEQISIVDEYRDFVLLTYRELRHLHHDAIGSVFNLIRENHAVFETAIRDGITEGQFKSVEPSIAVHALLSMLYMWAPMRGELDRHGLDKVSEVAKAFCFGGLEVNPATLRGKRK